MKFNTGSLPLGVREYTFSEKVEDLNLDDRFRGTVDVEVRLDKTERLIELQGKIRTTAALTCDRCAEDLLKKIETSYRMVYLLHEKDAGSFAEDEVVVLPSEYTVVDITEDVRQYLLLTMPFKVLCTDDCKGLCPVCGVNKNVTGCSCHTQEMDARWEPLTKLIKNN